jgi:hypothetical protein
MGYTISIPVQALELRTKFFQFMEKNFRHWSIVTGKTPDEWRGSGGPPTDDVFERPTSIGFNYQSGMGGFERDYLYSVIRWMAIKVGDRLSDMTIDETDTGPKMAVTFPQPTPYYHYDCEPFENPVLVVTESQIPTLDKDSRQWAVDEWGIRVGPTAIDHQLMSASEARLFNEGPINEMIEEVRALGQKPKNPDEEEAWWERRKEIQLKYLKPTIDENITLIRKEIQRLDQLWMSEV